MSILSDSYIQANLKIIAFDYFNDYIICFCYNVDDLLLKIKVTISKYKKKKKESNPMIVAI